VECSGGYVPAWFDAVYALRRWGLSGEPLLVEYPLNDSQEDRRLGTFEAQYELGNALKLSAGVDRFSDDSMTRGRLNLEIKESGGRGLQASLWSQADGPDEELFTEEANLYSRIERPLRLLCPTCCWPFPTTAPGLSGKKTRARFPLPR